MLRKLLSPRIFICILLFGWQATLDIYKDSLLEAYLQLKSGLGSFLHEPVVAKFPMIFLLLFIIHRAFIHGLIVRVFTGEKQLLKQYMALDLVIFFAAVPVFLSRKILPSTAELTEPFTFAFMKMLDSPVLLLFFLPSYYLFKNIQAAGVSDANKKAS